MNVGLLLSHDDERKTI